jgi:lipopolysaccharide biosynthesis protein
MSNSKIILYASYQTGENLPGYVQFALKHLAETDFTVVLLTNRRPLSAETMKFLEENNIRLYLTENHGYDFGMWRRFLKDLANGRGDIATLNGITRLLLVNDSIVYYQDKFAEFIHHAECNSADVISLTQNDEVRPHLQSFFLYIKQEALGAFYLHLLENPEQETFYDVVHRLEIGLSSVFEEAEVQMAALYHTDLPTMFAYPELIAQGAGFIKRKLLQRRFDFMEKVHFIRHKAYDALNADYHKLVVDAGLALDFKEEWIPKPVGGNLLKTADYLWEKPFEKIGWPLLRGAIKAKYKLLRKPLDGDEYKD